MEISSIALRALLKGAHSSLSIEFNMHTANYVGVAKAIEIEIYDPADWTSKKDMLKSINDESVWRIQWYPNTPVSFCLVLASSLEVALERFFGAGEE